MLTDCVWLETGTVFFGTCVLYNYSYMSGENAENFDTFL